MARSNMEERGVSPRCVPSERIAPGLVRALQHRSPTRERPWVV